MGQTVMIMVIGMILLLLMMGLFVISRYIRVPLGKLLVIYGKTGSGTAEVLAGGATFVWPVIQDYQYLDLTPFEIKLEEKFISKDNVSIPTKSKITFGISNAEETKLNAAERLLGLERNNIERIGADLIKGVMKVSFAEIDLVSIAIAQNKVREAVATMVNKKINQIGLQLINLDLDFQKNANSHLKELEQKFKEKKANSFEIGNNAEDEKQLEILNQKIEANAQEREGLIEEKLNLLVRFKNKN